MKKKHFLEFFCLQTKWKHPQLISYGLLSMVRTHDHFSKKFILIFQPLLLKISDYTLDTCL